MNNQNIFENLNNSNSKSINNSNEKFSLTQENTANFNQVCIIV